MIWRAPISRESWIFIMKGCRHDTLMKTFFQLYFSPLHSFSMTFVKFGWLPQNLSFEFVYIIWLIIQQILRFEVVVVNSKHRILEMNANTKVFVRIYWTEDSIFVSKQNITNAKVKNIKYLIIWIIQINSSPYSIYFLSSFTSSPLKQTPFKTAMQLSFFFYLTSFDCWLIVCPFLFQSFVILQMHFHLITHLNHFSNENLLC